MSKSVKVGKPIMLTCHHCKGKGMVELSGVYAETLRGVRRLCHQEVASVVANQWYKWFGCKPSALSNRLKKLEEHGFLRSEFFGRERRYFLV